MSFVSDQRGSWLYTQILLEHSDSGPEIEVSIFIFFLEVVCLRTGWQGVVTGDVPWARTA